MSSIKKLLGLAVAFSSMHPDMATPTMPKAAIKPTYNPTATKAINKRRKANKAARKARK